MSVGKKRRIQQASKQFHEHEIVVHDNDVDHDETEENEEGEQDEKSVLATAVDDTGKRAKIETSMKDIENSNVDSDDGLDIKIPLALLMTGTSSGTNECTVLVQVTPDDAPTLDFHGAGGAIGRFETSQDGLIMDLKGYQYQGMLQSGPTCIVASMHPLIGNNVIKVESITDEFVTIHKTRDQLAQLDAIVEKGDLDDSFQVKDTNVNLKRNEGDSSNTHHQPTQNKNRDNHNNNSASNKRNSNHNSNSNSNKKTHARKKKSASARKKVS